MGGEKAHLFRGDISLDSCAMKFIVKSFLLVLCVLSSQAAPRLTLLATNFKRPVDLQAAPGNGEHLFVVEQKTAKIIAIDRKKGKRKAVVLDLEDRVLSAGNEEGLLGLAFSPHFEDDHRLYVYYSRGTKKKRYSQISRFLMNPETLEIDAQKEEELLTFPQDFGNHNGGWIAFGPDHHLWIGVGDGGSANDPKKRAQDLENPLGSILRINVSGRQGYKIPSDNPFIGRSDAKPEIYAYGLRNPWRCSFDEEEKNFWIADVGQNHWEEINMIPIDEMKGKNFGWRLREGTSETWKSGVGGPAPAKAVEPIYVYDHHTDKPTGGLSVTGGYVYRGSQKELFGKYIFADYASQRIWALQQKDGEMTQFEDLTDTLKYKGKKPGAISSFAQDHEKELYIVDHSGKIFRID